MTILRSEKVAAGLVVQLRIDGHWMHFESSGHYVSVCIESKFENTEIIKKGIIAWIDEQLELIK